MIRFENVQVRQKVTQPADANPTQATGHADTQQLRYDKEVIVS